MQSHSSNTSSKIGKKRPWRNLHFSITKFHNDLSLCTMYNWILKVLSCIRFILLFSLSTMEHSNQERVSKPKLHERFHDYSPLINVQEWWKTSKSIWLALLHKFLTWSLNFKSLSTVFSSITSFTFDLMEGPSITAADGPLQPKRRWFLSLLAFINLLLNHQKVAMKIFLMY